MKKIISVLICVLMVLSLLPFTVSAADEIKFTLRIKEETEKFVTLVLDYDGGTGFAALDFEVSYDRIRLQAQSCQKGEGYEAFAKSIEKENGASLYSMNQSINPMKFSIANTVAFKAVGGKKDIAQITFTKVPGTKFAKEDVTVEFTNCQTASFTDIKVVFAYDLSYTPPASSAASEENDATEYPQMPSSDNVDDNIDSEIGDSVPAVNEQSNENEGADAQQNEDDNGDDDGSRTKTVIIIVAVAVCAVGVVAVILFKTKKK